MRKTQIVYETSQGVIADAGLRARIPFNMLTDSPNNVIAVPANGSAPDRLATCGPDGPMIVGKLAYQGTVAPGTLKNAMVALTLNDGQISLPLQAQNAYLHIDTLFGSGQQPYYLPEGLYIEPGGAINVSLNDLSGATNNIQLCFQSEKILKNSPEELARIKFARRVSSPFFYALAGGFQALTSGGVSNSLIAVSSDHWFELHTIIAISTGIFTLDLVDQAKNESFINAPGQIHYGVQNGLITGTANFPFKFNEPLLFAPGQVLNVALTDVSGAPNTIYITFGGRALWLK